MQLLQTTTPQQTKSYSPTSVSSHLLIDKSRGSAQGVSKKIFSSACGAIAVFTFMFVFIEYTLDQIPTNYSRKAKLIEAACPKLEVLVTGSSHSYLGIKPSVFCHYGFNLGNTSQSLALDCCLIRKYIDRMPKLKLIIMPISYSLHDYTLCETAEEWRDCFYYHYFHVSERHDLERLSDLRYSSLFLLYGREKTCQFFYHKFVPFAQDSIDSYGWYANQKSEHSDISLETGRHRVKYHETLTSGKHLKENSAHLQEIAAICRNKGIALVFITPPTYVTYWRQANPQKLAAMQNFIQSICQTTGAKYHNYFADARFSKSDFFDNDHLNASGADKFTRILNSEIVRPLCLGKS